MNCNDIGIKVTKQEFVDFLNSVQGGQFFCIKGYVNAEGEKSNQILRFGIKYGNLKDRDIKLLESVLAGQHSFDLDVKHQVWVPNDVVCNVMADEPATGLVWAKMTRHASDNPAIKIETEGFVNLMDTEIFGNRKSASRTMVTLSYSLSSNHPLVIAAIGGADLQGTILQGLINPRQTFVEYEKEAKSCYSLEKEGQPDKWYLRDILVVHKDVLVRGDYKVSASLPINAIKEGIRSKILLTGKYRQFILTDGQFDSITIEGQAVLCDGIDEQFFFALPEHVAQYALAE